MLSKQEVSADPKLKQKKSIKQLQKHQQQEQQQLAPAQPSQDNEKYLQKIKKLITVSNTQMIELVEHEDKFVAKINKFNTLGIQSYHSQEYQKSLIYLQQAEKILQYGASCGKTIDRFLIITTLHNQACVYQKLNELAKSYDYIQAILFNLKTYFDQNPQLSPSVSLSKAQYVNVQMNNYKSIQVHLNRKLMTIVYSLQFAAISSQINKHEIAIQSAKKALSMLKDVMQHIINYQNSISDINEKQMDLGKLQKYCLGIYKNEIGELQQSTRMLVHKIRQKPLQDTNTIKYKKFSIGQVMQLRPCSPSQSNKQIDNSTLSFQKLSTLPWLYRIVFYTSICYYTVATELRLISKQYHLTSSYQLSFQFQKSKIYHLFSIKIVMLFCPFLSDYHEHIIRSFKNNYKIDITLQLPQYMQQQEIKQSLLDGDSFVIQSQKSIIINSGNQITQQNKQVICKKRSNSKCSANNIYTANLQNINIMAASQQIRTLHVQQSGSQKRFRRNSSQFKNQKDGKQKSPFHLVIKTKKKKKSKSKSRSQEKNKNLITKSRQSLGKDRISQNYQIGSLKTSKNKLKNFINSSRTKLGKAKNSPQNNFYSSHHEANGKIKAAKSISTQKTKDQTKNTLTQKKKQVRTNKISQQYMAFRESSAKKQKNGEKKRKNLKKIHNQYQNSKSKSNSKTSRQFMSPKGTPAYGFRSLKNHI